MNWRIILAVSGVGVVMAVITIFGLVGGWEGEAWFVLSVPCAILIARNIDHCAFLHGFLSGVIAGLISVGLETAFIAAYLGHNPDIARMLTEAIGDDNPRLFMLIVMPFVALLSGLVLGLVTWLVTRLLRLRRPPRPQPTA